MIDTILAVIGPNGILYALGATVVAVFGFYLKRLGRDQERARQAQKEAMARDIADDVENDIGALTPEQRREALGRWSRS